MLNEKRTQSFPEQFCDRLLLGDCVEQMNALPDNSVDFILTDPPYLTRFCDRSGRRLRNDDNDAWLRPAFVEAFRILQSNRFMVCFYGWPKADRFLEAWRRAGFRPLGHFIAVKRYTSRRRFVRYQHETAYLLGKGEPAMPREPISDILPWKYTGNRWHPTTKPLCTLVPLIQAFSAPGELVFDPFAGSASTLVAAAFQHRHYCGVELDEQYFGLAQRRLTSLRARTTQAA